MIHHLPPLNLPSLALSMCPLYMFLDGPSSIFPHYPSPSSPLDTASLWGSEGKQSPERLNLIGEINCPEGALQVRSAQERVAQ